MKPISDDALLNQLQDLRDEVPPMPEGLHADWMRLVEEDAMKNSHSVENTRREEAAAPARRTWMRYAGIAAALVFLIGGTVLSRPALRSQGKTARSADVSYASDEDAYEAETGAYDTVMEDADYAYPMEEAAYSAGMQSNALAKSAGMGAAEQPAEDDRKVIRTVDLAITTRDYAASCDQLKALCEAHGGSVTHMSDTTGSRSLHTAYYTLRIPAENLDAFLAEVTGTGTVTRQEISASDVTESYRDTQARLATQQAKMQRLTELLKEATDISDLLAIESEIADTQYQIDSYQTSLNRTDKQVAYSTVDITLKEEKPEEHLTAPELTLGERLQAAITAGWESFVEFLSDMAVFLTAALPYLLVLALIIIVLRIVIRRRKK